MPKDFQRSRVYLWCNLFILPDRYKLGRSRSAKSCIDIVKRCCALYGVEPCRIVFKTVHNQRCAYYYPDGGYISLPPHMMRVDIVVHEAAHHIVHTLWPRSTSHGPAFVRVYMSLMHCLYGMDMGWLRSCARGFKVRVGGVKYDAPVSIGAS
jgi:hypothetical protein